MNRVTVKTSTIFIAKGKRTRVYRSVNEVPPKLRRELEASTNSFNSATILIADRRGRQEIQRVLNRLPSNLRSRLASSLIDRGTGTAPTRRRFSLAAAGQFLLRNWVEVALPAGVGVVIWLAFSYH